jgi:hypothetical protein
MNEMEVSLKQTQIESVTKIRIAEIEAKNRLDIAKKTRERRDIYWNGVLGGIIGLLMGSSIVFGFTYAHVTDSNNKAAQIARCEESGGVWTPRVQRVYDPGQSRAGDSHDEWYNICVK